MKSLSTMRKWIGGSIAAIALLIALLIFGPIVWEMTFITLVIPRDFSGPIAITYDPHGAEGSGILKWRRYTVPPDGKLRLKDKNRFGDWHILKAVRSDGSEVVTSLPGTSPSGEFLFCGPAVGNGSGDWRQDTIWYHFGTSTALRAWANKKPW